MAISASGLTSNSRRMVALIQRMSSASTSVGEPPPQWMCVTGWRPFSRAATRAISPSSDWQYSRTGAWLFTTVV